MSTRRAGMSAWEWDKHHGVEYGPNGFRLCRLCKTETKYKRATLCSDTCRQRWAILTSPSVARWHVEQRDKGVCALCGLDTAMLLKMIEAPASEYSRFGWNKDRPHSPFVSRKGYNTHPLLWTLGRTASLWDMDHIVPVVEGGGECDLDNLRTLCVWCHKQVTADLAARRSKRKTLEIVNRKRASVGLAPVQLPLTEAVS